MEKILKTILRCRSEGIQGELQEETLMELLEKSREELLEESEKEL